MLTRRALLKQSALLSLAPVVPEFLSRTSRAAEPERDGRVLVVLQLDGGNDGINTVVPFGDEHYAKYRRELKLDSDKVLKLGEGVGLHPAMKDAASLVESGRLAIVQGVGYPNPDRSHFESMNIWHAARLDHRKEVASTGWLGRALDTTPRGDSPSMVHVGDGNLPAALFSRRAISTSFDSAADLALDLPVPAGGTPPGDESLAAFVNRTVTSAYATAAELEAATARGADASAKYPETELSRRLSLVAKSIKSNAPAKVYYLVQSGYDTHSLQAPTQSRLLRELSGAMKAFLDDLAVSKLADRVVVMAFSEFGRRPEENGSQGTDHGTAGPLFVAGPSVQAGLLGKTPLLGDLENGDLKWSIDFRAVYATLLDRWLNLPADEILGQAFDRLPILRA